MENLYPQMKVLLDLLATRRVRLEQKGNLMKKSHPRDGQKDLMEKGIDLRLFIFDHSEWTAKYESDTLFIQKRDYV